MANRKALLRNIFSEEESVLRNLIPPDRGVSSSDISLMYAQRLSPELVVDSQALIEDLFSEAQSDPLAPVSMRIFKNIRLLLFYRKKGISNSFFVNQIMSAVQLPLSVRISYAKLLVSIDPIGKTFPWDEVDMSACPHLMPAKMMIFVNDPLRVLEELVNVEACPKVEVVRAVTGSALENCLEELLINQNMLAEYIDRIKPRLPQHWSEKFFREIIGFPVFEQHSIQEKLIAQEKVANSSEPLENVYNVMTSAISPSIILESLSDYELKALNEPDFVEILFLKGFKRFQDYEKSTQTCLFDSVEMSDFSGIFLFLYIYYRFILLQIVRKHEISFTSKAGCISLFRNSQLFFVAPLALDPLDETARYYNKPRKPVFLVS